MTVDVLLTPPDAAEVRMLGRGVVSAVYQIASARAAAAADAREYVPWAPDPSRD
jgi:hypothetical protein